MCIALHNEVRLKQGIREVLLWFKFIFIFWKFVLDTWVYTRCKIVLDVYKNIYNKICNTKKKENNSTRELKLPWNPETGALSNVCKLKQASVQVCSHFDSSF